MKKILATIFILAALLTGSAAFAQNSTVPQVQQWLTSNGYIKVASSTAGVQVPALGSPGSPCVTVGTTGRFGTSTCGGAGNTFVYPLVDTAGSVSVAYGTTTTNIWSNLQTFTNGFISLASSTAQYFNSASSSIDTLLVNTKLGVATSTPGQSGVFGVNGTSFLGGLIYQTATGKSLFHNGSYEFKHTTNDTNDAVKIIMDSADAGRNALEVTNATNWAHAGDLALLKFVNGSDSGHVLKLENAGTGNYIRADDALVLTKAGKLGVGTTSPFATLSLGATNVLYPNIGLAFGNFFDQYAIDGDVQEYAIRTQIQSTSSKGIDWQLWGGDSSGTNLRGSAFEFYSGNGLFGGDGGYIDLGAGDGDSGGSIYLSAGTASSTTGGGGELYLSAGSAYTDGTTAYGGNVSIYAGSGDNGGQLSLYAGDADDGLGGTTVIRSGQSGLGFDFSGLIAFEQPANREVARLASSTSFLLGTTTDRNADLGEPSVAASLVVNNSGYFGGKLRVASTTATSTFAGGIQLTNGTVKLDQIASCSGSNALTTSGGYIQCGAVTASAAAGGINTQLQYNDSTAIAGMDAYYIKANQRLGISTSTPHAKLSIVSSSTPQIMLTNMLGGTDQKHWVASTTASGFFHLGTLNDALTTITPRLTIDTSGRTGIGSTTPWGFLSVVSNGTPPEFIIATTTGVAPTFSVNATTSTIGGSVTVDSGARVMVGNFENYSGFDGFDQFHVDGRISSSWNYRECIPQGQTTVTADTFNYCNGWYWAEDNTGQTNITNTNGIGYMASLSTTAVANDGNGFFMSDGNAVIRLGTSTPIMETMANIGNIGTSTSYYFGYTTMSPSGTSYEVTPTVGCYFTASSTQANWWAICQTSASLITMVDTTIASSTTTNMPRKMRIEASDTIARFYIASTSERYVKIEITTNIPTNTNMTSAGFWNGFTGATSAALTQNRYFRFVYLKGWLKNQQRFIPF